jgi:hypothetical protein
MNNLDTLLKDQQTLAVELGKQYNLLAEKLENNNDYTEIIEKLFTTWKAIKTKHAVITNFSETQNPAIKDTPYFVEDKYGKAEHLVIQAQDALLDNQCKCAEEIKKIRTNIKKDSTARKTRSYWEQRFSQVQSYKQKYSENNSYLQRFSDKSDEYYKADMEKKVAEMADAILNEIKTQSKAQTDEETSRDNSEAIIKELQEQISQLRLQLEKGEQTAKMKKQKFRLNKFLDLIKTADLDGTKAAYEYKKGQLHSKWTDIEELHEEIMTDADQPPEGYEELYQSVESQNEIAIASLLEKITEQKPPHSNDEQNNPRRILQIKPLELDTFDGDYKKWRNFYESFTDAVCRSGCTNIEKFHHLSNAVKGEAKVIVSALQVSAENYANAIQLLKERFEHNRRLKTIYVEAILDAPSVQHRSPESIIRLHNTLKEGVINLEKLGSKTTNWGDIIIPIAIRKLDFETIKCYEEQLKDPKEMPSLNDFLEFLKNRHQTLESIWRSYVQRN